MGPTRKTLLKHNMEIYVFFCVVQRGSSFCLFSFLSFFLLNLKTRFYGDMRKNVKNSRSSPPQDNDDASCSRLKSNIPC